MSTASLEQIIEGAVRQINHNVDNSELLACVVEEVIDRTRLYLNLPAHEELDQRLVRVLARVASGIYNQTKAHINKTEPEMMVSAISDNGQSISFVTQVRSYLNSADDSELFSGFTKLLEPYRRCNVVS